MVWAAQIPKSAIPGHAGRYRDMGTCPDNILADILTLYQPRGTDYAAN